MRQVVRDIFRDWSRSYEGEIAHMYLDCKGLVTTGVGNLINSPSEALKLPWLRADGTPATQIEVVAEWTLIHGRQDLAKRGYKAAATLCRLHLSDDGIGRLVAGKLASNWDYMRGHYACFADAEQWPAPAQLAASSMAWAVGPGFPAIFKNWANRAAAKDWGDYEVIGGKLTGKYTGCAGTCWIKCDDNVGVIPRNKANIALFLLAGQQTPDLYDTLGL